VLKNISSSIVALVMEKGAHHLDLRFATDEDPDWVTEQRRQEVEIIEGWIDQYHRDMAQTTARDVLPTETAAGTYTQPPPPQPTYTIEIVVVLASAYPSRCALGPGSGPTNNRSRSRAQRRSRRSQRQPPSRRIEPRRCCRPWNGLAADELSRPWNGTGSRLLLRRH
ncbi:hypothetical protein ACJX0J_021498, partial [Zea mays]